MKRGGTKRKIEIKARETKQQKSVTCSKRRKTVFSKAADLCHLAGANVAVFVPSPAENSDVVYSFSGYCSSASEIAECYLNGMSPPPPPPQVINEEGFWWEDPDFHRYRESDDLSQLQVMEDRLLRSKSHLMAFLENKQKSQIVFKFDQNHLNRASSPGQNPNYLTQSSSPIVSTCDQNLVNGTGSSSHSSDFFSQDHHFCDQNLINGAGSSSHSSDFSRQNHHFLSSSSASSQIASFVDPSFWENDYGLSPLQDEPIINNEDPSFWDNVCGLSPLQDDQEEDKWMISDEVIQFWPKMTA